MPEVPAAVQAMVDATNAGDSDAFVAAFTSDAYLNDWGREFHGSEGVRSWDQTDNIGVQTHFDIVEVTSFDGDTAVVVLRVSGNGFNGTGPMTFTMRGDKLASMVIAPH